MKEETRISKSPRGKDSPSPVKNRKNVVQIVDIV